MAVNRLIFLVIFLAGEPNGIFSSEPKWETVTITFGAPLLTNPAPFDQMPLTETEAKNRGFKKLNSDNGCKDTFLGSRYMKSKDKGVIMIYDVNGYVAGIQSAVSKSLIKPNASEAFRRQSMAIEDQINGEPCYVLTAYLVKPDIICTTGRTQKQFKAEKGGTGLYIQNGTDPEKNYFQIPMNQSDVKKTDPLWILGRCFPGMGTHYWYNVSKDMDCNDLKPLFLLYTNHKLTGLGFAFPGAYPSSRFEHPPEFTVPLFMKPVPDCVHGWYKNLKQIMSMHIFLNMKISNRIC